MQEISLYWFAELHQTTKARRYIFGLFYLQYTGKFNELSPKLWKQQDFVKNWLKLKFPENRIYVEFWT